MHLFHWPSAAAWGFSGLVFLVFSACAASFGLASGLYTYTPVNDASVIIRSVAIALIAPGFLEELVFRGPLIMLWGRVPARWFWAIGGLLLLLFVLWHPFNATVYLVEARALFFDWRFLSVAAGLGGAASLIAVRTGSLWPAVAFHWVAVVLWKALLGAPEFF